MKRLSSLSIFFLVMSSLLFGLVVDVPVAMAAPDTIPPISTITLSGTAGSGGWYRSYVTVKVSAKDNTGGSGVQETRCVLDPATPPSKFDDIAPGCPYPSTGASVTIDGVHIIWAATKDKAGNVEVPRSKTFKMDATGPSASLSVIAGTQGNNNWYTSNVTVRTSGEDAVSGIGSCTADQTQSSETSARIFTGSCLNGAGLRTYAAPLTIKLDKTPPSTWVDLNPNTIWPPNHKLVNVDATLHASDARSGVAGYLLTSVTSSEPDEGIGDGDTPNDIQGFELDTADTSGQLRAESSADGNGRVYTLIYLARDNAGNSASASATTEVRHSLQAPRKSAIAQGADRVVEQQRTDPAWGGTWYWYVGNTYNATNLTGATSLGLLEAYRDTKDASYLDSAKYAAGFVMDHLGVVAPAATQYFSRTTAADIILLHRLAEVTGDSAYSNRASSEWAQIKTYWPTAAALDAQFRKISRRLGAWDMANYLEAAKLSGDNDWADGAAVILANTGDAFYYGMDNDYYPLTVSGALRALAGSGYADIHPDAVRSLLDNVLGTVSVDNVDGGIQATAYAVLALRSVGGPAQSYADTMAKWLAAKQESSGGWLEAGYEYAEGDGEAVQAIASTVGANLTLNGFVPGKAGNPAWRAAANRGVAKPFDTP